MASWRTVNMEIIDLPETYRVPDDIHTIELVVSNSRFVAAAGRADTVEAAKAFIDLQRRQMPTANHHVYAYRIGFGNTTIDGMSDDGEPSGTAGPPVMAVVRGSNIGDIVVVVTRFFGGTLLGTGGLVRSYSTAARQVLAALPTVENIPYAQISLALPYSLYDSVRRVLAAHNATIFSETFEADVSVEVKLPQQLLEGFCTAIRDLSAGKIQPQILE